MDRRGGDRWGGGDSTFPPLERCGPGHQKGCRDRQDPVQTGQPVASKGKGRGVQEAIDPEAPEMAGGTAGGPSHCEAEEERQGTGRAKGMGQATDEPEQGSQVRAGGAWEPPQAHRTPPRSGDRARGSQGEAPPLGFRVPTPFSKGHGEGTAIYPPKALRTPTTHEKEEWEGPWPPRCAPRRASACPSWDPGGQKSERDRFSWAT